MEQNRLGLVSVSFRPSAPEEIIDAVKRAGLTCIEWGSDVHAPADDPARLKRLAAACRDAGLACCSYGTYFRLGVTPLAELDRYFRGAEILGTDVLRLWCGGKSGADMTTGERETLIGECRKAAELAERAGMTVCLERHKKTFTQRNEDALDLMRLVNSPRFRMYWQPFQWQTMEENLAGAKLLAPFTEHIHVFNWRGKERFPLSEAAADWRAYLREFAAPKTLLLEFMPNDTLAELPEEAAALRGIAETTV